MGISTSTMLIGCIFMWIILIDKNQVICKKDVTLPDSKLITTPPPNTTTQRITKPQDSHTATTSSTKGPQTFTTPARNITPLPSSNKSTENSKVEFIDTSNSPLNNSSKEALQYAGDEYKHVEYSQTVVQSSGGTRTTITTWLSIISIGIVFVAINGYVFWYRKRSATYAITPKEPSQR